MAVYKYTAVASNKEQHVETGTVIARDKVDAYHKLRQHNLGDIRLKRIEGMSALFHKMSADIK